MASFRKFVEHHITKTDNTQRTFSYLFLNLCIHWIYDNWKSKMLHNPKWSISLATCLCSLIFAWIFSKMQVFSPNIYIHPMQFITGNLKTFPQTLIFPIRILNCKFSLWLKWVVESKIDANMLKLIDKFSKSVHRSSYFIYGNFELINFMPA